MAKWGLEQVNNLKFLLRTKKRRTVASLAAAMRCTERTIRTWKRRIEDGEAFIRPRRTSSTQQLRTVRLRRKAIAELAKRVQKKDGKVRYLFPSAQSIAVELKRSHGFSVTRSTVMRDFKSMKWDSRVRPWTTSVCPQQAKRRLVFSQKWVKLRADNIVFSDETVPTTNGFVHRKQWTPRGGRVYPRLRERWPDRLMVHGSIGIGYRHLVFFDPLKNKRLNAASYKRLVLQKVIPHVVSNNRVWMQDGARVHTAKKNKQYLRNKGCNFIDDWPANSPQLNPIEQVWSLLQKKIASRMASDHDELVAAIQWAWDSLDQSYLDGQVRSFTSKLKKCIKNRGKV